RVRASAASDGFQRQVPEAYQRHTDRFFTNMNNGRTYPILTFSGITISDPSIHSWAVSAKLSTEWWQATHR
ncbi:MAG: hypothetical protein K2I85_00040, partial [Alistipes sp.]|nr:hypothetical protein [Alistipes sp.]